MLFLVKRLRITVQHQFWTFSGHVVPLSQISCEIAASAMNRILAGQLCLHDYATASGTHTT